MQQTRRRPGDQGGHHRLQTQRSLCKPPPHPPVRSAPGRRILTLLLWLVLNPNAFNASVVLHHKAEIACSRSTATCTVMSAVEPLWPPSRPVLLGGSGSGDKMIAQPILVPASASTRLQARSDYPLQGTNHGFVRGKAFPMSRGQVSWRAVRHDT